MVGLNTEHVLIFVIVVFVLYMIGCRCSCNGNGFRVGGQSTFRIGEADSTTTLVDMTPEEANLMFKNQCCDSQTRRFHNPDPSRMADLGYAQCMAYGSVAQSQGIPVAVQKWENTSLPLNNPRSPFYHVKDFFPAAERARAHCQTLDY